jgi:hypothetical protein
VVSRHDNLRLMEKARNSSKGGKSWENWEAGRRLYGEQRWQQMVNEERSLRPKIREDITNRAARNRSR